MAKTLIFFHFYEADETYLNNLLHFLYFGYSKSVDYGIIITENCSFDLPKLDNVTYIYAKNMNWDYGGYFQGIKNLKNVQDYDYYFFLNCSVRGPFIPPYINTPWYQIFIDLLDGNVGLVGATINKLVNTDSHFKSFTKKYTCDSADHLQTPIYAMSKDVFEYLFNHGFYDLKDSLTKGQIIEDYELLLTKLVLDGGWQVKCLLPEFEINKSTPLGEMVCKTSPNGDILGPRQYFGRTAHPYETIFVKTNRRLYTDDYLNRLAHSMYWESLNSNSDGRLQSFYIDRLVEISKMDKRVEMIPIRTKLEKLKNSFKKRIKRILKYSCLI